MQHLRRMTRGDAAPRDAKTIEELQVTIQSLTDRIAALELQLEQRKSPQGDNEEEGCLINPPALDRRHIAVRRFPSYTAHAMRGALQSVVEGIPMTATRVVTNHLVLVSEANGLGTSTGGQVLSWVDICAGLAAKMLARSPCVTASVDSVHFLRPCRCVLVPWCVRITLHGARHDASTAWAAWCWSQPWSTVSSSPPWRLASVWRRRTLRLASATTAAART